MWNQAGIVCHGTKTTGKDAKMWALRKLILDAHILSLQEKVQKLELEVDIIVMETIKRDV